MFEGTGKKVFHCRRCMLKDARRRFLNGEDFVRVKFQEINTNSRSASPHGYNNSLNSHTRDMAGIQQENQVPQDSPVLENSSMAINFSCKRCLRHHQAYMKREHLMEHPIDQPLVFWQEEDGTQGNASGNTRMASPKGIWTADSLRGLDRRSPSPTGGRWVPSPLQRLSDKLKEEHLSLRFSDSPLTDCVHCLHHHGLDTTNFRSDTQPDQDRHQSGSKGNLEAKDLSSMNKAEELAQKENCGAWWAASDEECGTCRRCSSHHMNHEKLLKSNGQTKKKITKNHILWVQQDGRRKEQSMASSNSSPEFTTPTQNFSRSRTPTPQRSYNYREMYERKLQAGETSNTNNNSFELPQPWNQSGDQSGNQSRKIPNHHIVEYTSQCKVPIHKRKDDNNRAGSRTAWSRDEVKPSRKTSPGTFLQQSCHTSQGITRAQPAMKHDKSSIDSPCKSPKWSEECLHKRELTRRNNKRVINRIAMIEKGCAMSGVKYEKLLVGRSQSATHGQGIRLAIRIGSPKFERGHAKARMVYKSQIVIKTPEFTNKHEEVKRSTLGHQKERSIMTLEEKESHWALPPNWNIGKVTTKGVKGQSVSSKKVFKGGELRPTNTQDQKENLRLKTISALKSPKLFPPRMPSNETSLGSKGKRRQGPSPHHDEETNLDCKFEVITVDTKEFEERHPDCSIPVPHGTHNSSPNPKHIFLRIPKCREKNTTDNDRKAATKVRNAETKEKSPMSKKKCDRDMSLRVEIRSDLPLDMVDGRLKQFLKGIGGLIYYSPKDGGIPRIKELTNYFSGKQPLLWFSPRST